MKRCTDCKHFDRGVYSLKAGGCVRPASCKHPNNASLVDGSPLKDPENLRYTLASSSCGKDGTWWEAA
jgi:hypothetical protein